MTSPCHFPCKDSNLDGSKKQATVVGLYGICGAGKSFLLNRLKKELGEDSFQYYEGSAAIANVVPGGLEVFRSLREGDKARWRKHAIERIRKNAIQTGKTAVVTGHFMFCSEQGTLESVVTEGDLEVFTHILYLDNPADMVWQRRQQDTERARPELPVQILHRWLETEKETLRQLCYDHSIRFFLASPSKVVDIKNLLINFNEDNESLNLSIATECLDTYLRLSCGDTIDTFLVLDGDKTLTAEDTGEILWRAHLPQQNGATPLKAIFSSQLRYSYSAFRQVSLLYEQTFDHDEFDRICSRVATSVHLYPEMLSLLRNVQFKDNVGAVIVTCGLSAIWTKILEHNRIFGSFVILGGGRISDGFVVTPGVKAAIVDHLKQVYCAYVWAFGDSPLDLDMLGKADEAIVVVGDVSRRSRSMETELGTVIDNGLL